MKFYKRKRRLQRSQSMFARRSFTKETIFSPAEVELADNCLTNGTSTPGKGPITFTKHKTTVNDVGETVNGRHVKLPPSEPEAHHDSYRHSASLRVRLINRLSISRQVLLPGVSHLVKSITAAKYILTTLTALSLTWTPWLVTMSYDIYHHRLYYQQHQYGSNNTLNYQVFPFRSDM